LSIVEQRDRRAIQTRAEGVDHSPGENRLRLRA
jgi:hypothetical protein